MKDVNVCTQCGLTPGEALGGACDAVAGPSHNFVVDEAKKKLDVVDEAKEKLERIIRDDHAQYTAAFKLALLVLLDYVAALEAENRDFKKARTIHRDDFNW